MLFCLLKRWHWYIQQSLQNKHYKRIQIMITTIHICLSFHHYVILWFSMLSLSKRLHLTHFHFSIKMIISNTPLNHSIQHFPKRWQHIQQCLKIIQTQYKNLINIYNNTMICLWSFHHNTNLWYSILPSSKNLICQVYILLIFVFQ